MIYNFTLLNVEELASILGCKVGKLPTTYLGLPLSASFKSPFVWDVDEERFHKRDLLWKGTSLETGIVGKFGEEPRSWCSFAGREGYDVSLWKAPLKDSIPSLFSFASNKEAWVATCTWKYSEDDDKLIWQISKSGKFLVKYLYSYLKSDEVTVFHSGHPSYLLKLSDQPYRHQKNPHRRRPFPTKSFSNTDHTIRCAKRRSSTFLKAPEEESQPRVSLLRRPESQAPAR
ncbi:hypothetical protein CK203_100569 [Vitis vinifera]|uniref:Uncharacterized protein n=1 Tax=Vitis vinifera TaxID=29760 RepID=A0A438CZA5_VITVI|nr:hypothetical protein CK203_100569 [Vitis vinifera]